MECPTEQNSDEYHLTNKSARSEISIFNVTSTTIPENSNSNYCGKIRLKTTISLALLVFAITLVRH